MARNGNCYRGRRCDCVPDVDDELPPEPLTPLRALALIGVLLVSAVSAVALIGFTAGWVVGKL